ncbi:inorganic phosphate transporter [Candidatus Accumulibacter sp. ACC012]|uniref:inorganic phosphate transporter n=1 Tax=Candidatus Accumulibacter sp. ACC012 TaxID=2823332 RepID=UPI00344166B3
MEIIEQHQTIFLIMAFGFGLYMTWGIGANDVANAMGTSSVSGALTVKQAIIIAAIMEFAGAYLAGGGVASTISKGIIDGKAFEPVPELLVMGMLSALLAAGIWLMLGHMRGWPVSTTHTIIGAVVGVGVGGNWHGRRQWSKLGEIVASWFVSPVLGGFFALLLTLSIRKLILNTEDPIGQARKWGPFYAFLVGWLVSLVTITKGLKHIKINLSDVEGQILAVIIGVVLAGVARYMMNRIKTDERADKDFHYASVENCSFR